MTTNPLVGQRDEARQAMDLRAWCDQQNAKPLFRRMERWYYVAEKDGTETVTTLEGCDANNLRMMLDGTLQDFVGWSDARMNGYRRWLWSVAERGLIEAPRITRQLEPA